MTSQPTIFTIGHGTDTFDDLVGRITPHGVTTIVDVRSQPASRHAPDFTKRALERAAASVGLGYRWLGGSLGGRPEDDALYGETGLPDWEQIRATTTFRGGLAELIGLSHTSSIVIMCAELDPRHCHRTLLIGPELVASGFTVVDILGDGSAAPHQPPLV
jgi:uncharacterized protein (DUF488 family)